MASFANSLKGLRVPELCVAVGLGALSVPCFNRAREQREFADRIQSEYPSQSEYIRLNAELPHGFGKTFASSAVIIGVGSLLGMKGRGGRKE